jgi:hypothetical protein
MAMPPRAGAARPPRRSAVEAVATMIACKGAGRLTGRPREAGGRADAGRRACPTSLCAPLAGYPTSNQTSRVACPRILRCTRCRKTRTRACSRSVTSAIREAACSTLARRPSLISPQLSRWRRRPPDHAITVSTRSGASPATIAPRSARAPGAGSRSRPAAARWRPRRAREATARCPAPPPLERAPVCSPPGHSQRVQPPRSGFLASWRGRRRLAGPRTSPRG